jgi:fibronectin type 3 domain-containing protein
MKNYERYFAVLGLALSLVLSACSVPFDKFENIEVKQNPDISAIPVPQSVSAQTITASRIDLAWQDEPISASYSVYRSTAEDGGYTAIATVQETSYADNSVAADSEYFYYITLSANNMGEGGKSATVRAETKLPAVPQSLRADPVSESSIKLEWDAVDGVTGYKVYRSLTDSDYGYAERANVTDTTWTDTGLTVDTTYYYKIKAENGIGMSGFSATVNGTPSAFLEIPAAPAAPVVTAGSQRLTLSWSAAVGATAYEVWAGGSNDTTAAGKYGSDITGLSTVISGLTNGTQYYVWLKAKNDVGTSGFSPSAGGVPDGPTTPPAAPGTPAVSIASGQITISWLAVTGAVAYEIWYGTSPSSASASQDGDDVTDSLSRTISGLDNGTPYYIWMKAKNELGTSIFSLVAEGKPIANAAAPTVSPSTSGQLEVSWASITGADQYEVFYSTGATIPVSAAQIETGTSATISGLTNGTTYNVWIRGKNSTGSGAVSPGASAKPIGNIGAVTLSLGNGQLTASWAAVAGASQYEVYMDTNPSIPAGATQTIPATSVTMPGLTNGTTYYIWVKPKNESGTGAESTAVSGKPLGTPGAPTIIAGIGELTVSWSAVAGATDYEVYYGMTSTPTTPGTTVSGTSTTITGLTNETLYHVRLKARNSTGTSVYGAAASGTPSMTGLYDGVVDTAHKIGSQNLASALTYLSIPANVQTGHEYFIVLGANESASNIILSYPGKTVGITIVGLDVERTISSSANSILFSVGSGVTLTLDDKITLVGRSINSVCLVGVSGGTLVMNNGAKITGNSSSSSNSSNRGGGVNVNSGIFTMNGGTISGNTASYALAASPYTGGGGGVYVSGGTFTMEGGTINGNTASGSGSGGGSSSGGGGGVYVNGGTFTMEGGTISGNTAIDGVTGGGSVYVRSGNFTMKGGTISGNTAYCSGNGVGGSGSGAGGVYVYSGAFTMEGGTISGNTVSGNGSVSGVYVRGGTFRKTPGGGSNSGIIYGSEASGTDANGVPLKNTGHSIFATSKRTTTADQTDYIDTSTGQGLSASGDPPFGP